MPPRLTNPHQASTQEYPFIQDRNESSQKVDRLPASTPKMSGCCNEIQVIQGTDYRVVFRRLVREAIKWYSQGKAYSNIFVLLISLISLSLPLSLSFDLSGGLWYGYGGSQYKWKVQSAKKWNRKTRRFYPPTISRSLQAVVVEVRWRTNIPLSEKHEKHFAISDHYPEQVHIVPIWIEWA